MNTVLSKKRSTLFAAALGLVMMTAPQSALYAEGKSEGGDPFAKLRAHIAQEEWLESHPKEKFTREIEKLKPKAEKGDAWSLLQIADIYYYQESMRDYAEAAKWYQKAAEHGAVPENLGQLYLTGQGVPQNDVEAYFWYFLAEFHNTDAIGYLGPPEELKKKLDAGTRRAIRQRVAARIDQTDAHHLHLLGHDALYGDDYEDAYFWYATIQKDGIKGKSGQYDSELEEARQHLNDNAVRAVDLRVQEWQPSAPRPPK